MDLEELKRQRTSLDKAIAEEEVRIRTEKEHEVSKKISSMTEAEKETLLKLLKHDRTTCSDDNPCNGLSYVNEQFRCKKCMLIEILNGEHGGCYDFDIDVTISKI